MALGLCVFYIQLIWPYVCLPADILMWAETTYVGDIIKIRNGVPLYGAPEESNSSIYTPASPLLTYGIAWLVGQSSSIAAFRMIQLGFVGCAALIATLCCQRLRRLAYPGWDCPFPSTWAALSFCSFLLVATAPQVNQFVHCLHADALGLLASVLSFWTILYYLEAPTNKRALLMAACPALGFLIKQFLISWIGVMAIFLILHDWRNFQRLALFLIASVGLFLVVLVACRLLWGENFFFWTFSIMGGERKQLVLSPNSASLSLPRMLDHFCRAWLEIGLGVVGGWLTLRGCNVRKLGALWIAWGFLILSEVLSSGAGWGVLYHLGPGVLIGAIWLFAAMPRYWPQWSRVAKLDLPVAVYLFHTGLAMAVVATIFTVVHAMPSGDGTSARAWQRRPPPDVYRYIADIEHEFDDLSADTALLDVGNWIYLRQDIVARDRAVPLADQPYGGIYDNLAVVAQRIRARAYTKILVHDFHSPTFLYDWHLWEHSSGVRAALTEHYTEIRTIAAVDKEAMLLPQIRQTGPISVFVPRNSGTAEAAR
jgi:hypothetical protein